MEERSQLEEAIRQTPLFSLPKEDESAVNREGLRLIELCYRYLMCLKPQDWEPYGLEILQTVKRCIRGFDPEKGQFLHYFLAAWSREFKRIKSKNAQEPHADAALNDCYAEPSASSAPDLQLEQKESLERLLSGIEACYGALQTRQQPLMADYITVLLLPCFPETVLCGRAFFNPELLALWRSGAELPNQRDLAEKHHRDESSVSRSLGHFRHKLKQYLSRRESPWDLTNF